MFENQEETEKEKPPVPKKRTSVKQDAKEDDESKENEEKVEVIFTFMS